MGMREVIVTLGDRRNSGFCLKCGALLIQPYNDYQCCSKCTAYIQDCIKQLNIKKAKAKDGKVGGMRLIDNRNILKQVSPIGIPVK